MSRGMLLCIARNRDGNRHRAGDRSCRTFAQTPRSGRCARKARQRFRPLRIRRSTSKPQASEHRRFIASYCANHGLNDIEFIETQLDKDGRVCAQEALDHGADVVIAMAATGTVRTVASALSGTGHAMGIIPIGTGNLFARNMGIPVGDIETASPWQPRMGRGMWTWGA